MSFRNINNVTILADVDEEIILPSTLIALTNEGDMVPVNVVWEPSTVDTSREWESIHIGKVEGYVHDVLCSVHVSRLTHNPPSVFPDGGDNEEDCSEVVGGHCIDHFGIPKKDIHTSDIPDIDDYQYFKAKAPRTKVEEMQLEQLRELLADKIVLARDINHMRNAIIAIQKFVAGIENRVDILEGRVDALDNLLTEMVVDAENIGSGAKVFSHKTGGYANKVLNFRSLKGRGADVREEGNNIIIEVDEQAGCGVDVKGDTFTTCGNFHDVFSGTQMGDGYIKFTDHFGMKMVNVRSYRDDEPYGEYPSMLWVMGQGENLETMGRAGRMLKAARAFIIEYKSIRGINDYGYTGIVIDDNGVHHYTHESSSRINKELTSGQDAYTSDGAIIPDLYI